MSKKSQRQEDEESTPLGDEKVNRDDPMWKAVEAAMASGQLQLLRDGKSGKPAPTHTARGGIVAKAAPRPMPTVKEKTKPQPKPREEKSTRMQLLEKRDLHAKGGARLARRERRAEEREQKRAADMSDGDEEDGAGFFES